MTIRELYHKFKVLSVDFASVNASSQLGLAIKNTEGYLIELNKEQLYNGFDSKGNKLMQYQSFAYALTKNNMNPRPGFLNPDLKNTGRFYDGFFAKYQNKKIIFGSIDSKSGKLKEKYGNDIFGITKENEEYYKSNILREEILKIIERRTGLRAR